MASEIDLFGAVTIRLPGGIQLDDDLHLLLKEKRLQDAAEALAKNGWTSVSRLRKMKAEELLDLGLSSGCRAALEDLLQAICENDSAAARDVEEAEQRNLLLKRIQDLEQDVAGRDQRIQDLEQSTADEAQGARAKVEGRGREECYSGWAPHCRL